MAEEWSVAKLCEMVRGIGFTDAANMLGKNCTDGKTLCSADSDCFFTMDVGDEGLGLKPMQKARLKQEIDNATLRAPGGKAPHVPEIGARLSGAGADHGDLSRSCRGYEATSPPSVLARMEEACSSCRQLTGSSCCTAISRCIYSTM